LFRQRRRRDRCCLAAQSGGGVAACGLLGGGSCCLSSLGLASLALWLPRARSGQPVGSEPHRNDVMILNLSVGPTDQTSPARGQPAQPSVRGGSSRESPLPLRALVKARRSRRHKSATLGVGPTRTARPFTPLCRHRPRTARGRSPAACRLRRCLDQQLRRRHQIVQRLNHGRPIGNKQDPGPRLRWPPRLRPPLSRPRARRPLVR